MRTIAALLQAGFFIAFLASSPAAAGTGGAVRVIIDPSQAQAALMILSKLHQNQSVAAQDWSTLFATGGYQRLKRREAQFKRAFSDDDFKAFLSSPKTIAQYRALSDTLTRWTSADITQLAQRSFAYLPAGATLHATVYPMIKPRTNSFVFDLETDPAIMLYLDPTITKGQFGNTVSHELYHIGDDQNCPPPPVAAQEKQLGSPQKDVLEWMSAFGEGSAVLAAAGGPDIHPHAEDPPADRAVWDKALSNYNADFQSLQQFFTDIANGKLKGDAIAKQGYTYFGDVQGPWYTVGYKMDVLIERTYGRPKLIEAICDKREYFATYNSAAEQSNAAGNPPLPLWSSQLTSRFSK